MTALTTINQLGASVGDTFGNRSIIIVVSDGNYIYGESLGAPDIWHTVGATGEPAFQNNWVNFGGEYQDAEFHKDGNVVSLHGLIKSGTISSTTASGAIFTLPSGYRPRERLIIPTLCWGGSEEVFGRMDIHTDGTVQAYSTQSGTNSWWSIIATFSAQGGT